MTDTAGTCTPAVDFTNHYREALLAVRETTTTSGTVLGVGWMPSRGFTLSQDLDEAWESTIATEISECTSQQQIRPSHDCPTVETHPHHDFRQNRSSPAAEPH